MVIQHNMLAMNSSRQLGIKTKGFADKAKKLSSGYRINRAADDAAGLSISEKMRRQIRGLSMASQNAQEGISYVQSAEGALNEVHSLLQRGNELCIKAGNGTNTDDDRSYIQEELNQINIEIDRIAKSTTFNKIDIFDSSNARDSYGLSTKQKMDELRIYTPDMVTLNDLDYTSSAAEANDKNITFITAANLEQFANDLKNNYLPTILDKIQTAFPSMRPPVAGLEIGLKFYCENDGTLAYVGSNGTGYELGVNMYHLDNDNNNIKISGNMALTIAHEMTHAIMFDTLTCGMIGYGGGDSFPEWFVEGSAQAVGGAVDYCQEVAFYVDLNDDKRLSSWLSKLTDGGYASYAQGYIGAMYLGYVANGGGEVTSSNIAGGLDKIYADIEDGYSLSQAIYKNTNGKYMDLADFEDSFSKDAMAFTKSFFNKVGSGDGSVVLSDITNTCDSFLTGSTSGNYFTLNLSPGGYIDNTSKYQAAGVDPYTGGGATTTSGKRADGTINSDAQKVWGSMSGGGGDKAGDGLIHVQVGAEANIHININQWKLSAKDLGLNSVKVDTTDNADKAIDKFKSAIDTVSSIRSYYGAIQNRLEHTVANLDNVVENVTASESRIRDTDMAKLMVDFSKDNILMQAGQAMLAQANRNNQGILSLLD